MRKFIAFLTVVLILLVCSQSFAVTSGTLSTTVVKQWGLTVVTMNWVSDANGVTSCTLNKNFQGEIVRVVFNPSSLTGLAPSDDWDCILYDPDGTDVLMGYGTNHDTANTESIYFAPNSTALSTGTLVQTVNTLNKFYPWSIHTSGSHVLYITNAGAANAGRVKVYLRDPLP